MNVGVVIERLDPRRGGAESCAAELVRWLLAAGHHVTLVAAEWDPEVEAGCRALGSRIRIERIPQRGFPRQARACRFARDAAQRVAELKRAGRIDVAIDLGWGVGCDVVRTGDHAANREANLEALDSPIQRGWVRLRQFVAPFRGQKQRLVADRFAGTPPPHVIAQSQVMADAVRGRYRLPGDRVHVVPNGVDCRRFAPERLAALRQPVREELQAGEEVLVLTVAHNYRLKGVASVVALARRAHERHLPLRFVVLGGDDRQRRSYAELARRQGAPIRFLAPTPEVERYYAAADVFLLPTFYDACSMVVVEALAAGLPAITTARNGASELLEPGRTGFVVPGPRDLDEMERHLTTLLDPDRRARMSAAARQAALAYPCGASFADILDVLALAARERATDLIPTERPLVDLAGTKAT